MKPELLKAVFNTLKSEIISYLIKNEINAVRYKEGREIVTEADIEINRIITSIIHSQFPDHNIISEEGNGHESSSEYCWYVDPIDNSVGFICGETEVSVSICLKRGDQYIRSMVLNPRTGEVFEAFDGVSFKNGVKLTTHKGPLREKTHGVSTCAYVTKTRIPLAKEVLGRMLEERLPLRISGGSALDLCRVAEGRSYAHVCLIAHHWDVEAGIHILQSAGGSVSISEYFPERSAIGFIGASTKSVLEDIKVLLKI